MIATPVDKMEKFDAKGSLRTGGPLGMGISAFRYIPYADGSIRRSFDRTDRSLVYVVHLITILINNTSKSTSSSTSLGKKLPTLRDPCGVLVGFAVIRRSCRGNSSKGNKCIGEVGCCLNPSSGRVVGTAGTVNFVVFHCESLLD
jgi:hypothetical protein